TKRVNRSQPSEQHPPHTKEPPTARRRRVVFVRQLLSEPLRIEYTISGRSPVRAMAYYYQLCSIASKLHREQSSSSDHDKEDPHAHIRYFNKITSTNEGPPIFMNSAAWKLFGQNAREMYKNHLRASPRILSEALLLSTRRTKLLLPASAPAPVKAVEQIWCLLCGGAHSHQNCPATHGNVYRDNISEYVSQAAAANYNQGHSLVTNITNPRDELKRVSLPEAVLLSRDHPIPYFFSSEANTRVTKDQVHPTCSKVTGTLQLRKVPEPITKPSFFEPIVAPVVAPVPNTKPSVSLPYPSRRDNEKSRNSS
ncbi:hypothetical protein Tco_1200617, partial [Tanacetum coccineum]